MNKLFLKISCLSIAFLLGFWAVAQVPASVGTTTGLGQNDPAFKDGLWFSLNKVINAQGAPAGAVIDGVYSDKVWGDLGYNSTANTFPNVITVPSMMGFQTNPDQTVDGLCTPDKYAGTTATFAVAWDTTYLYVAVAVNSSEYLTAKAGGSIKDIGIAGPEIFIAADNYTRSYTKTNGAFVWGTVAFPRAYGPTDYQFGVGPLVGKTNKRANADDLTFAVYQGPFSDQSVNAFIKDTDKGYNIEMAIEWGKINSPFIDPGTGLISADSLKPAAGRKIGFDISNNVPQPNGQEKQAKLMWNQCCTNRGWSESIHFGVVSLVGFAVPGDGKDISITPNPLNITDGTAQTLNAVVTPDNASQVVNYSVINTDETKPVVFVSANGVVSPVNNGTATIIGAFLAKPASSGFVKSVTSVIVNVSNQASVTSLALTNENIYDPWGTTVLGVSVIPSTAYSGVTWSFSTPTTLATINTVTGVVRATGLGSGNVLVKATSKADGSVVATGTISIYNQTAIDSRLINIRTYNYIPCRGRGLNNMTLSGYSSDTKINLNAEFYDPYKCMTGVGKYSVVPPELMSYKLKTKTGGNLLPTIASLSTLSSGQTVLTIKSTQRVEFQIQATYLNNPLVTITAKVVATLNPSDTIGVQNSALCTVNGMVDPDGFTTVTGCLTAVGLAVSESIDSAPITLYPNPTTGDFSVDIDLAKGSIVTVTVANTVGSVVSSTKSSAASGKSTLSIGGAALPKGLYFITVSTSNGQSATKKLLVE